MAAEAVHVEQAARAQLLAGEAADASAAPAKRDPLENPLRDAVGGRGRVAWVARRGDRGRVAICTALLFALFAANGVALGDPPSAAAKSKNVKLKAVYKGPTCPSGDPAMQPLPGAQVVVKFDGRKLPPIQLDQAGAALLKLSGKGKELRAKVIFDDELLAVTPYGKDTPYSFSERLKLSRKKNLKLKIDQPSEKAGAASAWAILSKGTALAKASMPAGVSLPKVTARYEQGFGPTAGLPDLPGSETAYDDDQILIDTRSRADEFEPWVLLHEYGHHVLTVVADPGPDAVGAHDLERSYPQNPALPWSEGFAHAFAAIALENPVLGTQCRTGVNVSGQPASPTSKDDPWLNQYHEISVAGVVWSLATQLGNGPQRAGLKRLLQALHAFTVANNGGPSSLREARDALIVGGLEGGSPAQHIEMERRFHDQGIGWGVSLQAAYMDLREDGSGARWELHTALRGPYGRCESTTDEMGWATLTGMAPWEPPVWVGEVGAQGGLPYTSRDDCLVSGGDGLQPFDNPYGAMWLPFPYLAGQAHQSNTLGITATLRCEDTGPEPEQQCTSSRKFGVGVAAASYPAIWSETMLPTGDTVDLLRFDAMGRECTFVPTGEDCAH